MIDCVVVGAGPAGLAASVALAARGVDHVVLERDRPGESWRSQRWDSFRLNTPGWMNRLLGEQAPDAYLTGTQVVERLERLAAAAPVRAGVPVTRLAPTGDGYLLRTGDGELRARAVVVATGDQNRPRIPALAAGDAFAARARALIDERIRQRTWTPCPPSPTPPTPRWTSTRSSSGSSGAAAGKRRRPGHRSHHRRVRRGSLTVDSSGATCLQMEEPQRRPIARRRLQLYNA
jgi:glycine/D-amino acid oxidase-like deaminating enzyme